jgi:hypothetical protein
MLANGKFWKRGDLIAIPNNLPRFKELLERERKLEQMQDIRTAVQRQSATSFLRELEHSGNFRR